MTTGSSTSGLAANRQRASIAIVRPQLVEHPLLTRAVTPASGVRREMLKLRSTATAEGEWSTSPGRERADRLRRPSSAIDDIGRRQAVQPAHPWLSVTVA